jgi:hypothetical protein
MANALTTTQPLGQQFQIQTINAGVMGFSVDPGGAGGVTSVFGRAGAVVAQNGDYTASQVTNDSAVAGATVAAALNTLNATIDLTGSRVAVGPANTFLGSNGTTNQWLPVFTAPASPGDNGKFPQASSGNFAYFGATTQGQSITWDTTTGWVAGNNFGAQTMVTTDGWVANASTGYIRLGLAAGSGAGVASAASAGNIRGARGTNGFQLFVRNNGDTADITVLTTDTVGSTLQLGNTAAGSLSPLIAAPSGGTITLRINSSATQVQLTSTTFSSLVPTISFFSTVASPVIQQQLTSTASATGQKLALNAQDCNGASSTGGALDIRPGSGTTAGGLGRLTSGGGAVALGQRIGWNDTGVGLYTTTPVAQATRVGQLTDSTTGTPSSTIGDVGAAFSQSTLNNIHASLLTKINGIESRLSQAGGGIGVTA